MPEYRKDHINDILVLKSLQMIHFIDLGQKNPFKYT